MGCGDGVGDVTAGQLRLWTQPAGCEEDEVAAEIMGVNLTYHKILS